MRKIHVLGAALCALVIGTTVSCEKKELCGTGSPLTEGLTNELNREAETVLTLKGTIYALEYTSFMYGTHGFTTDDGTEYALISEVVQLDDYIGLPVTIHATEIDDFPVDGGPVYINVSAVIE